MTKDPSVAVEAYQRGIADHCYHCLEITDLELLYQRFGEGFRDLLMVKSRPP